MHRFINESDRSVVDQAKGALMLRYGIGQRESLAVLDRWAQESGASLPEVAGALVHGICLGRVTAGTEVTVRWLEQRLRGEVGDVRVPTARTTGSATGSTTERRATTAGLAPGEGTVRSTVPAPARPAADSRQWRYSSAVHAARVLRGL